MILCTVGAHDQPFDRLVMAMDEYATTTEEKVIIQRGCSTYVPQHAEHFPFTTFEHMQALYGQARLVVTHAAAGAIILGIKLEKHLVVVPRLSKFNEHLDDHQIQLACVLNNDGKAVFVENPTGQSLADSIKHAVRQGVLSSRPEQLTDAIQEQLSAWK